MTQHDAYLICPRCGCTQGPPFAPGDECVCGARYRSLVCEDCRLCLVPRQRIWATEGFCVKLAATINIYDPVCGNFEERG